MKKPIRKILTIFFCLYLIANLVGGIAYNHDLFVLLIASSCLYLLNLTAKPILNLLFMPINLLTLGASRWLINFIILFLVTIFVDYFEVQPLTLPAVNIHGFAFPGASLSFLWSLVLVSFLIEIITAFLNWLFS